MACVAAKRALTAVALGDCALHVRGDVARVAALLRGGPVRPGDLRELLLLEIANQRLERSIQHCGNVARCDFVSEQLLRPAKPVVCVLADADPNLEPLRCDRCDAT